MKRTLVLAVIATVLLMGSATESRGAFNVMAYLSIRDDPAIQTDLATWFSGLAHGLVTVLCVPTDIEIDGAMVRKLVDARLDRGAYWNEGEGIADLAMVDLMLMYRCPS